MRYIVGCLFILALVACNQHDTKANIHLADNKKPTVILQPLGNISNEDVQFLKDSIQIFYPVTTILVKQKQPPPNAWYALRNHWRADSIIAWLRTNAPDTVRLTIGLMTDYISATKGDIQDYGIMGLGYHPGKACVVSTFRLTKNADSKEAFKQRLFKVVAHEMGHNFGLPHCPNQHCIMVDAEGKMKLDGERDLCNDCKQKLKPYFSYMDNIKICCPKCNWEPFEHSLWLCSCGHQWNTFDTGGRCPSCKKVWEETQCISDEGGCDKWSPHLDWYNGLEAIVQKLKEEIKEGWLQTANY